MINKTKIYIFHPYSRVGGADLSLSRLINNINPNKYSISFITLRKPEINRYIKKKISIFKIDKKRTIFTIFKVREILQKDKGKFKKYIFLSNQNFANIVSLLTLIGINWIKLILIERNNPIELSYSKTLKKQIINILIKYFYKKADKIIAISKELSTDLSTLINKKVLTIYNPSFDKDIYKIAKKKIIFKKNNKIILSIARFEKQKNHIMLLKAFKKSLKKFDSKLILIGYGTEYQNIVNFIKFNKLKKNVIIIRNQINPFAYYKYADLFVLTSNYEGFGNVLIEAGMFKIPIISTNCKSGPKEILGNGKFGDLVKIDDYTSLSDLIIKNLKYPNKNKISKMYKSLNRFNIKDHIQKYEKVFDDI